MRVEDFTNGFEPDADLLALVQHYLATSPDQGDWAWQDYCRGLAYGLLQRLHDAGVEVPGEVTT